MLLFTVFCPGLGLEAQHQLGKVSGDVLLGGEGGVLQQGRGLGACSVGPDPWGGSCWVGARRGRPMQSGHRRNFT